MKHFRALAESRPWWTLMPDTLHAMAGEGRGPWATNSATITALAADGSFAIAYLPGKRSLTMDSSKVSGKAANAWRP